MILAVISLITALIGYFASKKSGADDTTALAVGAAAGAGAYYVGSQTEWGKSVVSALDQKWDTLFGSDGEPIKDANGNPISGPAGATPVLDGNGKPMVDPQTGETLLSLGGKIVTTGGKVLTSWGATGTAAVIGTAALASDSDSRKWLLIGGVGIAALLLLTR